MSLLFGRRSSAQPERRSLSWGDVFGAAPTGQRQVTPQRALQLGPVYAAVRLLADSAASLPMKQYRKTRDGREEVRLASHLAEPSATGTAYDWTYRCMTSLLLWGNAYGLRTGDGRTVEWLDPSDVAVDDSNYVRPVYYYSGGQFDPREVLHLRAFSLPQKVVGLSPVMAYSLVVDGGIAAAEFGRDWFTNGAVPSGTFKNTTQVVSPEQADTIKKRLKSSMHSRDPLVHGSDWEYRPITVNPDESQFIETMRFNAAQIAAVYGVPAEMIGGETGSSLTYSTVEQNSLNFVTYSLRPWLVRLEAAFSTLLPRDNFVRFNTDAMVRTDLRTRYAAHATARRIGLNNIDELRAVEDMPPLPDGQGQDYTPLSGHVDQVEEEESNESDDRR